MEGNLAVLGCGTMGETLVAALLSSGAFKPGQIVVTARRPARLEELKRLYGVSVTENNREAVEEADIVLISVKPIDVPVVLSALARTVTRRHLVISIAAGVSTSSIETGLPMAGPLVRAMPNVAARVGESMTALAGGDRAGEPDLEKAEDLFLAVGRVVRLPEHTFDAVTALAGSGPALFALFAEAMIEAGAESGLSSAAAAQLVSQTMLGTAALLQDGKSPLAIRQAVTSPGGTTAAALASLDNNGVVDALKQAVDAAVQRAGELGK